MFPLHDDNPTGINPYITISTIALCIIAFIWQLSLGPAIQQAIISLGVIPAVLFHIKSLSPELMVVPPAMTIFTSMFLHGGWMHLIGNMLYLWIFGNNVEDAMGHGRFIIFYLLCGAAAVFAQAIPDPQSEIPMVGASGACWVPIYCCTRMHESWWQSRLDSTCTPHDCLLAWYWDCGSSCN